MDDVRDELTETKAALNRCTGELKMMTQARDNLLADLKRSRDELNKVRESLRDARESLSAAEELSRSAMARAETAEADRDMWRVAAMASMTALVREGAARD